MTKNNTSCTKISPERIDWSSVLCNRHVTDTYKRFASGDLSARQATSELKNTEHAGSFRKLLRTRKTTVARQLVRKALKRRGEG